MNVWGYATLAALSLAVTPELRAQDMMGGSSEPAEVPVEVQVEPYAPEEAGEPVEAVEAEAEASAPRRARLTKPWGDLTSLTDEQRDQIRLIHGEGLAERRESEQRERDRIMALLSDEQKAELQELLDEQAMQRKLREAERRAAREQAQREQATKATDATDAPADPPAAGPEVAPDAQQ